MNKINIRRDCLTRFIFMESHTQLYHRSIYSITCLCKKISVTIFRSTKKWGYFDPEKKAACDPETPFYKAAYNMCILENFSFNQLSMFLYYIVRNGKCHWCTALPLGNHISFTLKRVSDGINICRIFIRWLRVHCWPLSLMNRPRTWETGCHDLVRW